MLAFNVQRREQNFSRMLCYIFLRSHRATNYALSSWLLVMFYCYNHCHPNPIQPHDLLPTRCHSPFQRPHLHLDLAVSCSRLGIMIMIIIITIISYHNHHQYWDWVNLITFPASKNMKYTFFLQNNLTLFCTIGHSIYQPPTLTRRNSQVTDKLLWWIPIISK